MENNSCALAIRHTLKLEKSDCRIKGRTYYFILKVANLNVLLFGGLEREKSSVTSGSIFAEH
jgi:hypothetical protein